MDRSIPLKAPGSWLLVALLTGVLMTTTVACEHEEPIVGSIRVERGAKLDALAEVTPEQAKSTALARFPGASIGEIELEQEDGYLVYAVDLEREGEEIEVLVDAGTGAVLKVEGEDGQEAEEEGEENDEEVAEDEDDEGEEDDEEVAEDDEGVALPGAVESAFHAAYPNAQILGATAERKDGELFFEIESRDGAVRRDLLYRPDGTLYEFEEPIEPEMLPESVRGTGRAYGRLVSAERITRGAAVEYEIVVERDGVRRGLILDQSGRLVEAEGQEEDY